MNTTTYGIPSYPQIYHVYYQVVLLTANFGLKIQWGITCNVVQYWNWGSVVDLVATRVRRSPKAEMPKVEGLRLIRTAAIVQIESPQYLNFAAVILNQETLFVVHR